MYHKNAKGDVMPGNYIKYRSVQLSLPEAAYNSIKILAQRENKPLSKYILTLVEREVHKNGLPVFFMEHGEEE